MRSVKTVHVSRDTQWRIFADGSNTFVFTRTAEFSYFCIFVSLFSWSRGQGEAYYRPDMITPGHGTVFVRTSVDPDQCTMWEDTQTHHDTNTQWYAHLCMYVTPGTVYTRSHSCRSYITIPISFCYGGCPNRPPLTYLHGGCPS